MPNMIPDSQSAIFTDKIFAQKTGVSRETMANIHVYASLLTKWQKKINLVSQSTMPDLWSRHFYDSFQLKAQLAGLNAEKTKILDIGSGAGFPGLLLSMLDLGEFHMVESNNKKCTFMRQVVRETGCDAVIHNERIENITPFHVDYIISRACAPLNKLFDLGRNFIHEETICLFLKGQTAEEEITDARRRWAFEVEKFTSVTQDRGILLKVSHIKALRHVD